MLTVSEHTFYKVSEMPGSLVAPFEPNPAKWYTIPWLDYQTGKTMQLATLDEWQRNAQPNVVHPSTFGFLFGKYVKHPAPDFLACDGSVCEEDTVGVLLRRPVGLLALSHIGKETDELTNELAHSGLGEDQPTEYTTGQAMWTRLILPAMEFLPKQLLSRKLKVSLRTLERWMKEETQPETPMMQKVAMTLNTMIAQAMRLLGFASPGDLASNVPAFTAALRQRNTLLQSALSKYEGELGLRQAAHALQISPPTLRAYTEGYLPRDIHKKVLLAEILLNIIVPASKIDGMKKRVKGRNLTLVSIWEALEKYASQNES